MKKWGWLLLAVLILAVSAAWAANIDDAIDIDGGDTIAAAVPINVNEYYTDYVESTSIKDYYKFTLPEAGYISVSLSHDFVDTSSSVLSREVINEQQKTLMSYDYTGNNMQEITSAHMGLPAGTYYLVMSHTWYKNVQFVFMINFTPDSHWETEFNDDLPSADHIEVNTDYHGVVWSSVDPDYYEFTTAEDGYFSFTFQHEYFETSNTVYYMDLRDAGQKIYAKFESLPGNNTLECTTQNFGLPAGTYYLRIHQSYSYGRLDYRIRVNYTESYVWETEFNDNIPTADPIVLGVDYHGTISKYGDEDFYAFTLQDEGDVILTFAHGYVDNTYELWRATILDAGQVKYLDAMEIAGNKTEVQSDRIHLKPGDYYLKIYEGYSYRSSADYSFRVDYAPEEPVQRIDISGADVEKIADQVYTGGKLKPAVTVTYEGTELVKNTDYKVSYKNNLNIGKATVTITGIGDYTGKTSVTFKILPKAVKLSSVAPGSKKLTVKWKKTTGITGYEIQYGTKSDFSGAKTQKVADENKASFVIKSLKAKKTYYVRIRAYKKVGGKNYYSAWSAAKKVKTK